MKSINESVAEHKVIQHYIFYPKKFLKKWKRLVESSLFFAGRFHPSCYVALQRTLTYSRDSQKYFVAEQIDTDLQCST